MLKDGYSIVCLLIKDMTIFSIDNMVKRPYFKGFE